MSEQSIYDKSVVIRNETQEYANTRGRVADVLDDINLTKANKEDLDAAIQMILDELDITESELYNYINSQNTLQNEIIATKVDKPLVIEGEVRYMFISSGGNLSWVAINFTPGKIPFWNTNSNLSDSLIYQSNIGNIGISTFSPSEKLEVNGNVKAISYIFTIDVSPGTSGKMQYDGNFYYGTNSTGLKKQFLQLGNTFEHQIRGKVLTSGGVTGTYNCDLNAYTRWILTLTGITTIAFLNMIADDETLTISMNVTGNFALNFPAWLKLSPYSDLYDGTKINRIVIEIGKGGVSPTGWYNIIKFDS